MASAKKPQRDSLDVLLEYSAEHDDPETARAELEAEGVDVPAFLSKVKARIAAVQNEARLSWLHEAKRSQQPLKVSDRKATYSSMERAELEARLRARATASLQAGAYFYKLESQSDDDLRSLLADLDDLDQSREK